MKDSKLNVGIVTSPFLLNAGVIPLGNMVSILSRIADKVYVLTGNAGCNLSVDKNVQVFIIQKKPEKFPLYKLLKYISSSLRIISLMIRLSEVRVWVFFMGERPLLIPIFFARLIGKKVVFISSGSMQEYRKNSAHKNPLFRFVVTSLEGFNHMLADNIILYSENLAEEKDLSKYKDKIIIASEHYVDFTKFKIEKNLNERGYCIGYLGRLSEEKGVLNFVESIPKIISSQKDAEFIIAGEGQLKKKIELFIKENGLSSKVSFTGWIQHDKLPGYLNNLRLIIIPSYSEGLPNILLEAMACGTPVLVSAVGAIPDVIKNGENGFLLKDNSPDSIAESALKILDYQDINRIIDNAGKTVHERFSFDEAVLRFSRIAEEWRR